MRQEEQKSGIRLNKYISEAGICSRREADRLIEARKVTVDGVVAIQGIKVTENQNVKIGKKEIRPQNESVVLAVYKPVGIICTEDKKTKHNIIRFLKYSTRVTYVGRLDKDSEGLLLMTNDGDIINKIMRAGNRHEKEYRVTVQREITSQFLEQMALGVHIKDEEKKIDEITRPCKVQKIGTYTFKIVLTQGINRQIRRMCKALGYEVKTLKRVRVMQVELNGLRPGEYRKIEGEELTQLYKDIKESSNQPMRIERQKEDNG